LPGLFLHLKLNTDVYHYSLTEI